MQFPVLSIREVLQRWTGGSERVAVHGWVRTVRQQKQVAFVVVADGSNTAGIQAVVNPDLVGSLATGTSVRLEGALVRSIGANQSVELKVDTVTLLGDANPENYPLHKAKLPLEHLRDNIHLRSRTRTFTSMWKLRNATFQGFHSFFQKHDFIHINTPIITSSDCEGAGEAFRVFDPESFKSQTEITAPSTQQHEQQQQSTSKEFFTTPANLTVSSQLHLEAIAAALPRVYTISPAFRAEKSLSTRHLAEFWMLEAECAFFTDLGQVMDLVEAGVRAATTYVRDTCTEDLDIVSQLSANGGSGGKNSNGNGGVITKNVVEMMAQGGNPFHRITYTEALRILQQFSKKKKWQYSVDKWGCSLQSEHERFLADEYFKGPVFVTDYPAEVKPFYMLDSSDCLGNRGEHGGKTVACVDLLVPGIGELVGGSLREHSLEKIEEKIKEKGLSLQGLEWYLDLRRFGSVPHGGFGLGMERYLMTITGMSNIKDVIPIPRWYGHCSC
ncbi:hypothetical protein HK100_002755 [Physocladia obscura]|uniref:asparagine--tRNA ligase n=1 Tax=Physocladia obscura TaxID=109957 RepID=A0AAD5XH46_9FUNG|nr:hypothetical protein HK100_002755 [Physocladia obscura]